MIEQALLCLVIAVSDGDTLTVRCGKRHSVTVRLADIDAPEKGQAFGKRSKQYLSALCSRKTAEIRPVTRDRYGRTVARVNCNGTDANAAMVRAGLAWAYTQYLTDPRIRAMEAKARREGAGLWSDPRAVPPWAWRNGANLSTAASRHGETPVR